MGQSRGLDTKIPTSRKGRETLRLCSGGNNGAPGANVMGTPVRLTILYYVGLLRVHNNVCVWKEFWLLTTMWSSAIWWENICAQRDSRLNACMMERAGSRRRRRGVSAGGARCDVAGHQRI